MGVWIFVGGKIVSGGGNGLGDKHGSVRHSGVGGIGMTNAAAQIETPLSPGVIEQYWSNGFLFPVSAIPLEAAVEARAELEALEQTWQSADLPHPLTTYKRVNAHVVMPLVARLATRPEVLDAVGALIGPDILLYAAEIFIKEPRTTHVVTMHQDLTYWGLGAIDGMVTAWIALSPATRASGCMDFVKGSHKNAILPHEDTFAENNLLSRGQEVKVDVKDSDKTAITLAPGEFSLHHGLTIHGSGPNASDDRRIGVVVRYLNPEIRQQNADLDYAALVRGEDRYGNFRHIPLATTEFSPEALRLYDEIRAARAQILMQGAQGRSEAYQ